MTAFNGLQANPDDISRFEQQAASLAAQIPSLPGHYTYLNLEVNALGGTTFQSAMDFMHAYATLTDNFLKPSGSNISDLQDQVDLFGKGAGSAASGYTTTAANENTNANGFLNTTNPGGG